MTHLISTRGGDAEQKQDCFGHGRCEHSVVETAGCLAAVGPVGAADGSQSVFLTWTDDVLMLRAKSYQAVASARCGWAEGSTGPETSRTRLERPTGDADRQEAGFRSLSWVTAC